MLAVRRSSGVAALVAESEWDEASLAAAGPDLVAVRAPVR
jgi:hypothetical protein